MAKESVIETQSSVDFETFKKTVIEDYKLATLSREASLLGRREVLTGKAKFGILICGSANGVAMTANKHQKIRAGLCWTNEIVELIRQHNNANVLCIPARFTAIPQALKMVETFLNTEFEGGRHQNRIDKIPLSC